MSQKSPEEFVADAIEHILILDRNEITPQSNLRLDLSADSLDLIEIVMVLEEDANIELENEEVEPIKTVSELTDLVAQKLKERGLHGRADF